MSVSLIVLRLELADDTENSPDFAYKAPHFELPVEYRKSYAEVVERPTSPKLEIQEHKGRREFQPITIQTYYTEEIEMDDELEPEVTTPELTTTEVKLPEFTTPEVMTPHSTMPEVMTSDNLTPLSSKSALSPLLTDSVPTSDQVTNDKTDSTIGATSIKMKRRSRGSTKPRDKDSPIGEKGACVMSSRPGSGKAKVKASSPVNTVRFFSGNPAVEKTEGIIHLYKNNHLTSLTEDTSHSELICMLTVPAFMTSQDLLLFVAPVEPWVENIKIIRDSTPNQYMVLLRFRSQKYADDFYKNFNGINYNSLESDMCHLAYVAKIETMKASEGASLPICGLTELPVCPVCLERMDESVDGVLTVLCNHSFHGSCLAQWGDTSCPVCRYMQTPEPVPDHKCFHCDSTHNLWICLICGHVGCGRYEGGHAHTHFQETNHTYSMHLENSRVWDYAGDNFVHRLVQNKGDGKLVEVDEGGNMMDDEKLDSVTLEYTYLLASQLEAQRHHFEEKIERVEKEALVRIDEMETRSKKSLEKCSELERHLLTAQKEKNSGEKKATQLAGKIQKISSSLTDEQQMNSSLRENQEQWHTKVVILEKTLQSRDQRLHDVEEQLRDVMFYLEAQQKFSETTAATQEEIQEGQIVVPNGATGGATGTKRGRKKGGR